ncbi:S1 family peptidase [Spirosoma aerolatum]|uniref:S1 family peptidase n=1 Tax=Spirosoma aerolatum TaxID=1211326 RepID=UPI0014746D3A|nr:serine protease [Spirosoma aerolatum]
MTVYEQLSFATIKINCVRHNGSTSSGTGFFFNIQRNGDISLPIIITNKHVIRDAAVGTLNFTTRNADGTPNLTNHYPIIIQGFEQGWTLHPDPDVDLCAFPLAPMVNLAKGKGVDIFYIAVGKEILPTQEQLAQLDMLEDVIMVGYPNGFSDTTNNKPIFRRGITATSIKLNYCGKPEFLIDSAVFPGSSGSPVFIANSGSYTSGNNIVLGSRILLVGVAYAVYQHNAMGQIIQTAINQINLSVITGVPNHIGIIIRYDKILDFEKFFSLDV